MTFTLTVTPEGEHSPPRVLLEATESETTNLLKSVALYRDGVKLRFDPVLSGNSAVAYDYDAPFDQVLTYRADASDSGIELDWSETWASLGAWTASNWSVSAGVATSSAALASMSRVVSSAIKRLTVVDPVNVTVQLFSADPTANPSALVASVQTSPDGTTTLSATSSSTVVGSGSYTLTVADASISVTGTGWSAQVPFTGVPTYVQIVGPNVAGQVSQWALAAAGNHLGVAVDPTTGSTYVIDANNKLVRKLDNTGAEVLSWSTTGSPIAIATDVSGYVYVADVTNSLIRKYDSSGTVVTSWTTTAAPQAALTVDPSGNVFAVTVNGGNATLRKYNPAGTQTASWAVTHWAHGVALDSTGNVFVVTDSGAGTVLVRKYDSSGTPLTTWSTTDSPVGVVIDSADNVWVTTQSSSYLLRKYDNTGVALGSVLLENYSNGLARDSVSGDLYVLVGPYQVAKFTTSPALIDDVAAYIFDTQFDVTDTETITLTPSGDYAGAWLTNASQPDLAIRIDAETCADGDWYIVDNTRDETSLAANTVAHAIEGSADVVTVAVGPRRRETWVLNIACKTPDARQMLLALLSNSAVVNLRLMASQQFLGLASGFYAVGDVSTQRDNRPAIDPTTVVSLPLTPARAPAYKPLWQWNMRALAQTGLSMREVNNAYTSMHDLLIGPS